jgi:hypothetical protein
MGKIELLGWLLMAISFFLPLITKGHGLLFDWGCVAIAFLGVVMVVYAYVSEWRG